MAVVAAVAMLSGCAIQRKPETAASFENITLQETVLFDFNKYTLREDAKPILEKVATIMKANPHVHAVVEGHADRVGSAAYNEVLAEKRARAVGAYLTQNGVKFDRVTFISMGKRALKDLGHTKEADSVNRRAEIHNH